MHEWGITQSLIDEIKNQAGINSIKSVTFVEISLGRKSDMSRKALTTCFKVLAIDEIIKGCKLKIKTTAGNELIIDKLTGKQD